MVIRRTLSSHFCPLSYLSFSLWNKSDRTIKVKLFFSCCLLSKNHPRLRISFKVYPPLSLSSFYPSSLYPGALLFHPLSPWRPPASTCAWGIPGPYLLASSVMTLPVFLFSSRSPRCLGFILLWHEHAGTTNRRCVRRTGPCSQGSFFM